MLLKHEHENMSDLTVLKLQYSYKDSTKSNQLKNSRKTMATELQTADRFLQLMSAKSNGIKYSDNFKEDLGAVTHAPLRLPKNILPKKTPMVKEDGNKAPEISDEIALKFKSIKPPFKFSVELKADSKDTIYEVKEKLMKEAIKDDPKLEEVIVAPSQFKLMLKSKVIHDSTTLSDLGSEKVYSFIVMTTKASEELVEKVKKEKETRNKPARDTEDSALRPSKIILTDEIWKKIRDVIGASLEEDADIIIDRLKKGWELTN